MKSLKKILPLLLCGALAFTTQAQVGNPAPNFTVTDTHGNTHTLYDYLEAGKVVVLDFFYTTCGPCQFYAPQANLAYEKYGCNNANVIFMSIDYDDTDAQVLAYDAQYGIQYPSVSGIDGGGNAVVDQYNILGFPTFYVIDSSQTIIDEIDPPTLQVFDFRFQQHGILPADCNASAAGETNRAGQLDIFPNPVATGGSFRVRLPEPGSGLVRFEIFHFTGQSVEKGQVDGSGSQPLDLKVGALPPGIFLLKITPVDGSSIYSGVFVME